MYKIDAVKCLTSLPVSDVNYAQALKRATSLQIKRSLEVMRNREGKDKGRIRACERELKRRSDSE